MNYNLNYKNKNYYKNTEINIILNYHNYYVYSKNIDIKKYSILDCKFANTYVTIRDINIDMKYNFLINMKEELPQYMENMVGLMMKKIFYNVKKFVDKVEES